MLLISLDTITSTLAYLASVQPPVPMAVLAEEAATQGFMQATFCGALLVACMTGMLRSYGRLMRTNNDGTSYMTNEDQYIPTVLGCVTFLAGSVLSAIFAADGLLQFAAPHLHLQGLGIG